MAKAARIYVLGVRGSIPVDGAAFERYGGASSCVLVDLGGEVIILDAGTGILNAQRHINGARHLTVLLSHAHIDHILGIPMFSPLFNPAVQVDIYGGHHEGYATAGQIDLLMKSPLWPCGPEVFHSGVRMHDLPQGHLAVGDVEVDWMEGNHPGGCIIYGLTYEGRRIVYCTDFEHGTGHTERLIAFARGCDVMLYDAQYAPEEYPSKVGWGHSTWVEGARIGRLCGAGRVLLCHHAPERTDDELDLLNAQIQTTHPECTFARGGSEIIL